MKDEEKEFLPGMKTEGFRKDPKTALRIMTGLKKLRDLYPSEREFFKERPYVAGMATEDDHVIINPYSPLDESQKRGLYQLEDARLHMRHSKNRPEFELTDEQKKLFKDYSPDPQDQKETLVSRIAVGDQGTGFTTLDQVNYTLNLLKEMEEARKKSR